MAWWIPALACECGVAVTKITALSQTCGVAMHMPASQQVCVSGCDGCKQRLWRGRSLLLKGDCGLGSGWIPASKMSECHRWMNAWCSVMIELLKSLS